MAAEKTAEKKKGKKKAKAEAGAASEQPSVAAHPKAARSVSRAKGWGGLAGFLIAGYLSLPTSTLAEAGLRALVAGSVCYVAAWAGAVFVWRRLVMVELRNREQQQISEI
jgi:predicted lipid-binding transport protein (Tim44 family)